MAHDFMSILRAADLALLPPGGGWICVKGNPLAPRGDRIPRAIAEAGVKHLDVVWGINEKPAFPCPAGLTAIEDMGRAAKRLRDYIYRESPHPSSTLQTTLVTISHPYPGPIRFYNGELATYSEELIRQLLSENLLEIKHFGVMEHPFLEDSLRDIVDALQVDGCSLSEAWCEAITGGIVEMTDRPIPMWYYRPIGAYRTRFVEEHTDV